MYIKRLVVGELDENCYILEKDGKYLVIDPGDNFKLIDSEIKGELEEVLVTHYHEDHIGALDFFKKKYHLEENLFLRRTFRYEVIKTPGHTSDSISFYFPDDKIMFTGDFLFSNSIGRMDLPSGSHEEMIQSLEKIKKYPENTVIYPGHYSSGILGVALSIVSHFFD